MPRLDDLIDGLSGAHYISTLDFTNGYWKVPVAKYQLKIMPFGLVGDPSIFQRMMNMLFGDVSMYVEAYVDDSHVQQDLGRPSMPRHVDEILSRLTQAGLTVKIEAKVAAVMIPNKKKDVRSFLGLAGCYRKFIPA